jgi:hypothetical protein
MWTADFAVQISLVLPVVDQIIDNTGIGERGGVAQIVEARPRQSCAGCGA